MQVSDAFEIDFKSIITADVKKLTELPNAMLGETEEYNFYRILTANRYPMLKEYWKNYELSAYNRMRDDYSKECEYEKWFRQPHHNVFKNNYLLNSTLSLAASRDAYENECENNFFSNAEPGFVDFENKDYNLLTNARIYSDIIAFENINFGKIGPSKDFVPLETDDIRGFYPCNIEVNAGRVNVVYSPVYGSTNYKVLVAADSDFSSVVGEYSSVYNVCEIELAEKNTVYYWKVIPCTAIRSINLKMQESPVYSVKTK